MTSLAFYPEPGTALVQLSASDFGDIPIPEKPHDSQTWGRVIALNDADKEKAYLTGRIVYWRKFKDDARVVGVKEKLVFIELADILGSQKEE